MHTAAESYKNGASFWASVGVFSVTFATSYVNGGVLGRKIGGFGAGIWDKIGEAAFDLTGGLCTQITVEVVSNGIAENVFTRPEPKPYESYKHTYAYGGYAPNRIFYAM